jgi:hypothetical protein
VHEQVRLLAKETGKGHSDIKQKKKMGEYHLLFWLAEEIQKYSHGMLWK